MKQKAIRRQEEEEDQVDRVREWEEGLPSLADLISLSQCLISPQLASAFSITSPSPPPTRSPADVALASHTAFSSLRLTSQDLLGSPKVNPHPQPLAGDRTPCNVEDPQLNGGHGAEASQVNPHPQLCAGDRSPHVAHVSERIYNGNIKSIDGGHSDDIHLVDLTPLDAKERTHGGGVSVREWHGNSQSANAGHLRSYGGDASVGKYHGSSAPLDPYGGGNFKASERDGDGEGQVEGHACANAGPCISDSSDFATRVDVDNEAEEDESTPSPTENPNAETMARTLKRPRLVWTPELHKRFVDAVSHLGVKTAVPKTIMQLMNVEGLTRENVASHLQKYRLYLKRMQGLSNEGPTSSDHLFASTPVPTGLATPGRFHAGMPVHLQDINQVPFVPSHNPISMGRGHISGIMSGPLPPMDPFSFNIFARPPSHRFVQGDVQGFRQHQFASSQHAPKK